MTRSSPRRATTRRRRPGGMGVHSPPRSRRHPMELINALLAAGPLGYLVRDRRVSLGVWLGIWAVVFPIQTVVVWGNGDGDPVYFLFNALILGLGIGLNFLA